MKRSVRMAAVLLLLVLQLPVLNGVAHAAGSVSIVSSFLRFIAASGKANDVTVSLEGTRLIVEDQGDVVTAGPGCTSVTPNKVSCTAAGVTGIGIQVGDRNDTARNSTAIQSSMFGDLGDDQLIGGPGRDRLDGGAANDRLIGASGDDELLGGSGDDRLIGNNGKDRLVGSLGDDELSGGSGNDELLGGLGNDELAGGPGGDSLNGGDGVDGCDPGSGPGDVEVACET